MGQILWPQWESVILSARPCPAGYPTDSVTVGSFSFITAAGPFTPPPTLVVRASVVQTTVVRGFFTASIGSPRCLPRWRSSPGSSAATGWDRSLVESSPLISSAQQIRSSELGSIRSAVKSEPGRAHRSAGLGERRPPSERKHAALGAQESGVFGNRLVIGDLQFQRRIGLTFPAQLFTPREGGLMRILSTAVLACSESFKRLHQAERQITDPVWRRATGSVFWKLDRSHCY